MQESGVRQNRKFIWEKFSQHAVKDSGECEKTGLVQDWCVRVSKENSDHLVWAATQC